MWDFKMISSLLDVMLNEGEIDERDKLKYSVLFNKESFYCKASKYEWKGFLSIMKCKINYFKWTSALWCNVTYSRSSFFLNFTSEESDMLYVQFMDYSTYEEININEALLQGNKNVCRIDITLFILTGTVSYVDKTQRCWILFRPAKNVLMTQHSNAGIESLYSLVNRKKPIGI